MQNREVKIVNIAKIDLLESKTTANLDELKDILGDFLDLGHEQYSQLQVLGGFLFHIPQVLTGCLPTLFEYLKAFGLLLGSVPF